MAISDQPRTSYADYLRETYGVRISWQDMPPKLMARGPGIRVALLEDDIERIERAYRPERAGLVDLLEVLEQGIKVALSRPDVQAVED